MKIAIIGGGNMGEAMLSAILDKGLAVPKSVSVSDIDETRRRYIEQKYGVSVVSSNRLVVGESDVVVLAIKPQELVKVMVELKGQLKPTQLVLSIVSGAKIDTLLFGLNHNSVVRVMPNLPAQIGEGMSVWTATADVTEQQKKWVVSILKVMGKEIFVDNEAYINMATAVSGSGPAYAFFVMESLVDAAVHIGLPSDIAEELVLQTILGSVRFVQKSGKRPAELRDMVTSRGGTTIEAMRCLKEGGFSDLINKAVSAAYNKARRLGG
jgi:pyrroline-5-carboxylate reductase